MPTLTLDQMDRNALSLAIALADVAHWTHHGDGVIGADVDGYEVIVSVQEDGTVSIARYDESGEEIEAEADDVDYDADAVRAALAAL